MSTTSSRLLLLLSLLQARRDWPGGDLATRLDVSPRTVRRDVDRLRELGYPVLATKGPDGGYRLEAGVDMPPLLFDDDQAVAIAVALQVATRAGAGIEEGAARALNTIRQVMPARLRHRIDLMQFTAVERPVTQSPTQASSEVLIFISSAVQAREVLRFDYTPAYQPPSTAEDDDSPPRRVEPHHVVTWGGRWYLVAWDLDRDDWRIFRADGIVPRIPTGPRFSPRHLPDGDVATFVISRFQGAEGWACRGEVILDLPAHVVARYSGDGVVEAVGPDRCRLVLGSWSWAGLVSAVGRFDTEIEVIGPPELKVAFAELARRYAEASA